MPIPLSVLDVSPIPSGSDARQALQNTLELAQLADRLGYTRYWLAEHHNSPGIASSAPEILIGHLARATTQIRVGSGGVMLPNQVPLKVVETFRLLEALYPGRIDLGIGRAPGTDTLTALALRRSQEALRTDDFPQQLAELLAFAGGGFPSDHPFRSIIAAPGDVPLPPVWLLGSSDFSAGLAAQLGLGFAFARHINPPWAVPGLRAYRAQFQPSDYLQQPYAILTLSVICAEREAEVEEMALSLDLSWLRLRTGNPGPFPSPAEARAYPYTPVERAQVPTNRARHILGTPSTVRSQILDLVEQTQADEVMVLTMTHDQRARLRSYELLAEAFALQPAAVGINGAQPVPA
jgi:luciferase family oxidoreductase group 1